MPSPENMPSLTEDERAFPIQTPSRFLGQATVCKNVYMAAYEVYSHVHGRQQAMIEGGCRGGFGSGELIAFLYARAFPKAEWSMRADEAFRQMEGFK